MAVAAQRALSRGDVVRVGKAYRVGGRYEADGWEGTYTVVRAQGDDYLLVEGDVQLADLADDDWKVGINPSRLTLVRAASTPPPMSAPLADVVAPCPSHPEDGESHQCMVDERRCVYCGVGLNPYGCNGCGKFLTTAKMHAEEWRCEECI